MKRRETRMLPSVLALLLALLLPASALAEAVDGANETPAEPYVELSLSLIHIYHALRNCL